MSGFPALCGSATDRRYELIAELLDANGEESLDDARHLATGGTEMFETPRNSAKSRLREWLVGSEEMPPYLLLSFLVLVYLTGVLIRISTAR